MAGVLLLGAATRGATARPRTGQPWLGVVLAEDEAPGVRIKQVLPGSPADTAGLRAGDRLLRVAGGGVNSVRAVQQAVAAQRVGQRVTVQVRRGARTRRFQVTLEAMPSYTSRVKRALLGRTAPAFSVLRAGGPSGQVLRGKQLRGHVVLLEFWTSWCGACRSMVPFMKALHAQYQRYGLEIVAIARDPVARVAGLAQRLALPYRVAADPTGAAFRAFGIRPVPAFVLLDRKGVVQAVAVGANWGHSLRSLVRRMHGLLQKEALARHPGGRGPRRPGGHGRSGRPRLRP